MPQPAILVTKADYERIDALLNRLDEEHAPGLTELQNELYRARVVAPEDLPPDVVSMNSTACFEDTLNGRRFDLTLVYPHEIDGGPGKVSILAPVGSALLGLSVGQTIDWQAPGGKPISLRILEVRDQPEARQKAGS